MNIKRAIINAKWAPSSLWNRLMLRMRGFKVGRRFRSYGTIFIRGAGSVAIGDDVTVNSCRETNPIGGDTKTVLYAKGGGAITIGSRVGISNAAIIAMESIAIEDDVMLGGGCKLYDHDFHSIRYEERMQHPDPGVKSAPIVIRQGAFVGAQTIVLKGVTIGRHSVVGAGSVVTRSVPDGEIWAGNPARLIRKLDERLPD